MNVTRVSTHVASDMACALEAEIARCACRAAEFSRMLESIGAKAFETAGTLHHDADARELLRRAYEVRGLVRHALGVLADLQNEAGRMHALAALREVGEG